MKVAIYTDEWYPVYSIHKDTSALPSYDHIEVDDDIIQEWDQMMTQFYKMQNKLIEIIRNNNEV